MTDNETIKALECCIKSESNDECRELGCPFFDEDIDMCGTINSETIIQQNALDLINRQKAEIEAINVYCENLEISQNHLLNECATARKGAKTEAIKEFAERFNSLLAEFDDYDTLHIYEIKDRFDSVKEMVVIE